MRTNGRPKRPIDERPQQHAIVNLPCEAALWVRLGRERIVCVPRDDKVAHSLPQVLGEPVLGADDKFHHPPFVRLCLAIEAPIDRKRVGGPFRNVRDGQEDVLPWRPDYRSWRQDPQPHHSTWHERGISKTWWRHPGDSGGG